jgi:hydroxymethylbilane synthase
VLARRPDLRVALLRGNVPTRIAKLDAGQFDAVILAAAGLTRLGLGDRITQLLPPEISVPAVAQGVLGLETRAGDDATIDLVRRAIHDPAEEIRVIAERAFLARMGGSCQTPLAAHAILDGDDVVIDGLCGMPDGTRILRESVRGSRERAAETGIALAVALLARGAGEIIAASQ